MNIEYKNKSGFSGFFISVKAKKIAVMYDVNTKPYALDMIDALKKNGNIVLTVEYPDEELIPDEKNCDFAYAIAQNADYVLAVGSGTLNDMAKSIATRLGIESGVLATAASMDGYCSKGAALMRGGFKVTDTVNPPSDVLIDTDIVCNAPALMTAAGFGDIIGKYTCLTDWKMANVVKGEPIHQEAYALMENALSACINAFEELVKYENSAVEKLMNALITAGLSMEKCGNSRPASGSEHHISHYLEMDFVKRGERVPLHGIKVAIGCLISICIYKYIESEKIYFHGAEKVYDLAKALPSEEQVREMLVKMGCPVRFSQIGVRRETMEETIERAYAVRDRYTVLTLAHDLGITDKIKPLLMDKYY